MDEQNECFENSETKIYSPTRLSKSIINLIADKILDVEFSRSVFPPNGTELEPPCLVLTETMVSNSSTPTSNLKILKEVSEEEASVCIDLDDLPVAGKTKQPTKFDRSRFSNTPSIGNRPWWWQSSPTSSTLDGLGSARSAGDSLNSLVPDHNVIYIRSHDITSVSILKVRNRYVHKVYGVLTLQFLFSLIFSLAAYLLQDLRSFFEMYGVVVFVTFIFDYVVLALLLIFVVELKRWFPVNLILMILITVSFAVATTSLCIYFNNTESLVFCLGFITLILFSMSVVALQSRWDVISVTARFYIVLYILIMCTGSVIILYCLGYTQSIINVIITTIEVLIFIAWLIHVTDQLINRENNNVLPEEYIFGALILYVDVLLIFMFVVECTKICKKV